MIKQTSIHCFGFVIFCCAIIMMRDRVHERYIQLQYPYVYIRTWIYDNICVFYIHHVCLVEHHLSSVLQHSLCPKTHMIMWAFASSQFFHPHGRFGFRVLIPGKKAEYSSFKSQVKQRCHNIKNDKTTENSAILNKVQRIIVLDCLFLRAGRSLSVEDAVCLPPCLYGLERFWMYTLVTEVLLKEKGPNIIFLFRTCQIWQPKLITPQPIALMILFQSTLPAGKWGKPGHES